MIELDVVIPVYNEGQNIKAVLDSFREHVKTPMRVLICYDHDGDTTLKALEGCGAPFEIKRIKNPGRGAHGAVLSGMDASDAPALLVCPADDDHNARIVDRMVAECKKGAEIVVASRFMPGGSMEGCPWLKHVLVRASAFVLKHFARLPTHDPSNGLRLFSRKVLDTIFIESKEGFTYSIEILVKCHRLRWKIVEVPSLWIERRQGKSRFRVVLWLPAYLRWFFYAFATTCLLRGPSSVIRKGAE